jgi:hypothetical protein
MQKLTKFWTYVIHLHNYYWETRSISQCPHISQHVLHNRTEETPAVFLWLSSCPHPSGGTQHVKRLICIPPAQPISENEISRVKLIRTIDPPKKNTSSDPTGMERGISTHLVNINNTQSHKLRTLKPPQV